MFREEEVRRGIALLDKEALGWRSRFNPGTLSMAYASKCTLSQVYGAVMIEGHIGSDTGFNKGMVILGLSLDQAADHGFARRGTDPLGSLAYHEEYEQLGETWKTLVPLIATELIVVEDRELVAV